MDVTIVKNDGREWVKVIDLSPTFTILRGPKGRMMAPAISHWMRKHIPDGDKTMLVSGTVKHWKDGSDMPAPPAIHVTRSHVPALMAYARRREATAKDRAVLSYAYTNMQKEAS